MTSIVVNTEQLSQYGNSLSSYAKEYDTIVKEMDSIVEALQKGWNGQDYNNFKANVTEYLSNAKAVRDSLLETSSTVYTHTSNYNKRIEEFNEKMRG